MSAEVVSFRRVAGAAARNEVLVPVLHSLLYSPKFPKFSVKAHPPEQRAPDGWFHPSTHPLLPARQLYYYLTEPERLMVEPLDPIGTIAIVQGNFWHRFVEICLTKLKVVHGVEVPVQDDELGTRGHMDGVLDSSKLAIDADEVFEFKTMNDFRLGGMPEGTPTDPAVLEWLKNLYPHYWAQANEYMRMSGLKRTRMLFWSLSYPFPCRELVVPYDEFFAFEIAKKYAEVRKAVINGGLPLQCCNVGSKEAKSCFARAVCPIGLGRPA